MLVIMQVHDIKHKCVRTRNYKSVLQNTCLITHTQQVAFLMQAETDKFDIKQVNDHPL
jgi:hypothetical protein